MFKNLSWEDVFYFLLAVAGSCAITAIMICVFSKKTTLRYSLGTDHNDQHVVIIREVDWCKDDEIQLDRSIPYLDAVKIVDSLNKTLK